MFLIDVSYSFPTRRNCSPTWYIHVQLEHSELKDRMVTVVE